jgi:hypothetical protein
MKKVLILMLVTGMLAMTTMAFAGGGQNCNNHRADNASNEDVSPWHVSGECPWE